MSQHRFYTHHQQAEVCVVIGWDRPLGRFFMFIEKLAADLVEEISEDEDDGSSGLLYNNLNEKSAFDLDLDHYRDVLAELGIPVPDAMFEQALLDETNNTGNRIVYYSADGGMSDEPPNS